jgi:hypothetical protein
MLATVAQFKAFFGIGSADTVDDVLIGTILGQVSTRLAKAAHRTWKFTPCLERTVWGSATPLILDVPYACRRLNLPAWPIVSVQKVQYAADGDWASADELVEHEDYEIAAADGCLIAYGQWLPWPIRIRVEYIGGYDTPPAAWVSGTQYAAGNRVSYGAATYECILLVPAPATTAPSADTTHWTASTATVTLPDDLYQACLDQAGVEYRTRNTKGVGNVSGAGGSAGLNSTDSALLKGVAETCMYYWRGE